MIKKIYQYFKKLQKTERTSRQDSLHYTPKFNENFILTPEYISYLAKMYSGKYLLKSEIVLSPPLIEQLQLEHYFKTTKSIDNYFLNHKRCLRCHNDKPSLFATIPCAKCAKTHYYCRKCIHMGRVLECELLYYWDGPEHKWPKNEQSLTWSGKLTKSQEHASNVIVNKIKNGGELLSWAVTGSGKTEMLFPGIQYALSKGFRICIATPRADVVRELLPRLKQAFRTTSIQGLFSGSRDNDGSAQLLISTTHQLLRYRQAFDLLIIDEIDAFPYHQDMSLSFAAKRSVKPNHTVIYLTATPRKKQLTQMKQKKLDYVFVPIRFHGHQLPIPLSIYTPQLIKKLQNNQLPKKVLDWFENRKNKNRQLLIFVPTIKATEPTKKIMKQYLLSKKLIVHENEIQSVSSEDPLREQKIYQFRKKEISCLITTTILGRGVTFPSVDVIALNAHHEVFDEQALVQIAGRAGRSWQDPGGEVIFFHEGETDAIVKATEMICMMNKKGKNYK